MQTQQESENYTPKELIRMSFGRRLQAEMIKKGWNQSELARYASKHMPDGRVFGRDLISGYVRGRILPGPIHLNALAKAFGKKPDELLPQQETADLNPPLKTEDLGNGRVLLKVNQTTDWPTALKILELLTGKNGQG